MCFLQYDCAEPPYFPLTLPLPLPTALLFFFLYMHSLGCSFALSEIICSNARQRPLRKHARGPSSISFPSLQPKMVLVKKPHTRRVLSQRSCAFRDVHPFETWRTATPPLVFSLFIQINKPLDASRHVTSGSSELEPQRHVSPTRTRWCTPLPPLDSSPPPP